MWAGVCEICVQSHLFPCTCLSKKGNQTHRVPSGKKLFVVYFLLLKMLNGSICPNGRTRAKVRRPLHFSQIKLRKALKHFVQMTVDNILQSLSDLIKYIDKIFIQQYWLD